MYQIRFQVSDHAFDIRCILAMHGGDIKQPDIGTLLVRRGHVLSRTNGEAKPKFRERRIGCNGLQISPMNEQRFFQTSTSGP